MDTPTEGLAESATFEGWSVMTADFAEKTGVARGARLGARLPYVQQMMVFLDRLTFPSPDRETGGPVWTDPGSGVRRGGQGSAGKGWSDREGRS